MADIIDFSGTGLIITDRTDPMLMSMTRSGGMSINGFEQIVSPLSSRWEWSISIPIFNSIHMRAYRAFLAQMQGRFNYARIRVCDQYRMSRREQGAVPGGADFSVTHSDDTTFSDGTGYDAAQGSRRIPNSLPAGARSLKFNPGFDLVPGTFFSLNGWLYQWTKVDEYDVDMSPNRTWHFMPPLREAAAALDEINFDAISLWRLASDDQGGVNLRIGRFGTATLRFVEPVGR